MRALKTRAGALWREHLRLTLLRFLAEQPGYRANSALLCDGADAMGFGCTRDQIEAELRWLGDQGLVTIAAGVVTCVTATKAGLDVAEGRREVPGVRVPSPDDEP